MAMVLKERERARTANGTFLAPSPLAFAFVAPETLGDELTNFIFTTFPAFDVERQGQGRASSFKSQRSMQRGSTNRAMQHFRATAIFHS